MRACGGIFASAYNTAHCCDTPAFTIIFQSWAGFSNRFRHPFRRFFPSHVAPFGWSIRACDRVEDGGVRAAAGDYSLRLLSGFEPTHAWASGLRSAVQDRNAPGKKRIRCNKEPCTRCSISIPDRKQVPICHPNSSYLARAFAAFPPSSAT